MILQKADVGEGLAQDIYTSSLYRLCAI